MAKHHFRLVADNTGNPEIEAARTSRLAAERAKRHQEANHYYEPWRPDLAFDEEFEALLANVDVLNLRAEAHIEKMEDYLGNFRLDDDPGISLKALTDTLSPPEP